MARIDRVRAAIQRAIWRKEPVGIYPADAESIVACIDALAEERHVVETQRAEIVRVIKIVSHIRAHHRHDEQACATAIQELLEWLSRLEGLAARSADGEGGVRARDEDVK